MDKLGESCKWIGHSGLRYTYTVLKLPCTFHAGQVGNFIFARKSADGRWSPVFIGQGNLAIACTPINEQWECILSHRATHFHCHLNEQEQAREQERNDLLSRYKNAFCPYGCNPAGPNQTSGKDEDGGVGDPDPELPTAE